ncbi:MAG: hypothetical protein RB191_03525 [Terriglobia bacterium]|nr:hypothetical protein [Terriglobia bacterium]
MDKRERLIERQKQNRLEQLGTNNPVCLACGRTEWPIFEEHHIAGCRYCALTILHCKNCHAIATAKQKGHPPPKRGQPSTEEIIGRLLLGLADFFELLIETLRKFGEYLIEKAQGIGNAGEPSTPKPNGST